MKSINQIFVLCFNLCFNIYRHHYVAHKTALHIAVEKGNLEIIYLLTKREDIDYNALDGILNIFFNDI